MLFWLTSRNILLFISAGFAALLVMVLLNIMTVGDLVSLGLNENIACYAEKLLVELRQVSSVLVELFRKLFIWAGVDVDLSKVGIVNNDVVKSYCLSGSASFALPSSLAR